MRLRGPAGVLRNMGPPFKLQLKIILVANCVPFMTICSASLCPTVFSNCFGNSTTLASPKPKPT